MPSSLTQPKKKTFKRYAQNIPPAFLLSRIQRIIWKQRQKCCKITFSVLLSTIQTSKESCLVIYCWYVCCSCFFFLSFILVVCVRCVCFFVVVVIRSCFALLELLSNYSPFFFLSLSFSINIIRVLSFFFYSWLVCWYIVYTHFVTRLSRRCMYAYAFR